MEDFIIILIGFAVMLYSAYSKNKKSKERQAHQNDVDDSYDNNSDITSSQKGKDFIEQFFGYDTNQSDHPFDSKKEGEKESFHDRVEMSTQNIGQENVDDRHISNPYNAPDASLKMEAGRLPEEGLKSTKRTRYGGVATRSRRGAKKKRIDLRSAVIYSEILNRKY